MRKRELTIAAMLAALMLLPGCMGEDEDKPAEPAQKESTETAAESEPAETTPAEPIASRDGVISDTAVTLEVVELKRGGETAVLTLRLTSPEGGVQIGTTFDDGVQQKVEGATNTDAPVNSTSMDGITLIDTENRKRYLVGRDSKGVCTCDSNLGGVFLSDEGPANLSATYAAPPEDVSAVDLLVPSFGTFKDVPVS